MNVTCADLFICFNEDEHEWVQTAAAELEARLEVVERGQVRPFLCFYYTQDMPAGEDWHKTMLHHAAAAHRCLLVVSPGSLASECCKLEINERIRRHPLHFDALVCGNRVPNVKPLTTTAGFVLGHERWLDFLDNRPFIEQLDELTGWLCRGKGGERIEVRRKTAFVESQPEPLLLGSAFARFLPCLGFVNAGLNALPLGCAWFAEGRRFRCDLQTARAAAALLPHGQPCLCWNDDAHGVASCLPITHVDAQDSTSFGNLYVAMTDVLPDPPTPAPTPLCFEGERLGIVVATTGQPARVGGRAAFIRWRTVDGVQAELENGDEWLPGAPIFDALGRLAGCLTHDSGGMPLALPIDSIT